MRVYRLLFGGLWRDVRIHSGGTLNVQSLTLGTLWIAEIINGVVGPPKSLKVYGCGGLGVRFRGGGGGGVAQTNCKGYAL